MDLNTGEGFAVVSLQCSLIETIECFYKGWLYKTENLSYFEIKDEIEKQVNLSGGQIFKSFFSQREPFKNKVINGKHFYKYVRCGLLHETQTKNNWVIRKEEIGETEFYKNDNQIKIIFRTNFQKALEEVINNYKMEILHSNNTVLRQNFINKFNHICDQS